jgi:hypothetical protein
MKLGLGEKFERSVWRLVDLEDENGMEEKVDMDDADLVPRLV